MGRLSVTHALALRRLGVAGGALAASLVAHCAAAGDLALTATAQFAWAGLLAHAAAALVLALLATRLEAWLARAIAAVAAAGCLASLGAATALGHSEVGSSSPRPGRRSRGRRRR